jgi:hypothetical protein
MRFVLSLVWYPWTESVKGAAHTEGQFKRLRREVDANFARLPAVGETFFFEDGGQATIEATGWQLDGDAYLFLGKHLENNNEPLELWTKRGFEVQDPPPTSPLSNPPGTVPPAPGKP